MEIICSSKNLLRFIKGSPDHRFKENPKFGNGPIYGEEVKSLEALSSLHGASTCCLVLLGIYIG